MPELETPRETGSIRKPIDKQEPVPGSGISVDRANELFNLEKDWLKSNFSKVLISALERQGFPVDAVKQNEARINERIDSFLKGAILDHSAGGSGYAQHVGKDTSIFFDKVDAKALALKTQNPQMAQRELDGQLRVFIRDTLVHEAIHHLQPAASDAARKEWVEGGAELISNLMLQSRGEQGKVTYQSYLPVLAETLSGERVGNGSVLREQFVRFSALGFLQTKQEAESLTEALDSSMNQVSDRFRNRADAGRRLLGYDFASDSDKSPEMSQAALRLLASGTYSSLSNVRADLKASFKEAYEKEQANKKR